MYTQIFWTFRSSKKCFVTKLLLPSSDHNLAPKWKTIHTPPPPQILKMIKDDTLPFDNIAHDLFMDVVQSEALLERRI